MLVHFSDQLSGLQIPKINVSVSSCGDQRLAARRKSQRCNFASGYSAIKTLNCRIPDFDNSVIGYACNSPTLQRKREGTEWTVHSLQSLQHVPGSVYTQDFITKAKCEAFAIRRHRHCGYRSTFRSRQSLLRGVG